MLEFESPRIVLFQSHSAVQICIVSYVEYFVNSREIYLVERFVQIICDSTYCNFLNSKLRHRYFLANITYVFKKLSIKPSSRTDIVNEKIRTHVELDNISFLKLLKINMGFFITI